MKKKKSPNKSLFITFEGGEGAGKTTLIHGVKEWFEKEGYSVIVTREPGGTPFGDALRDLLLHRDKKMALGSMAELFLFLSARAQHVEEVITPALREHQVVLCDRFSDSTIAYQGYARDIGMDLVAALNRVATGGLSPHITFYLDIDPKIGLARASKARTPDRMEELKLEFHAEVRAGFLKIAEAEPERVKVIDGSRSPEDVLTEVLNNLRSKS